MIRYKLLLLIIITSLSALVHGQRIMGGMGLGLNLSQVDGDQKYGFKKTGLNAGPFALVQFNEYLAVSIETVFNQKGAYGGPEGEPFYDQDSLLITKEYQVNLNYLEVPVIAYFTDKGKALFGMGFSYGRLVGVKEFEHGNLVPTTTLNTGPYDVNDFNIIGDFKFKLYQNFWLGLRYNYSLDKIRTRTFYNYDGTQETREQFNNLVTFRIVYIFKDKFYYFKES